MNKSNVVIATPCGERWETMTPDGGGRLCATCDKVVHDLSAMSEERAKRLLASKQNLCVRYLFDEQGNIWFEGERPPLAARLLNRAKRGAFAAATIAAPFLLQACMGSATADDVDPSTAYDAGDGDGGLIEANPALDDDASSDAGDTNDDASDAAADASNDGQDGGDGG